ncbi:MAG: AAA family ATPase [Pseudomonadota bacterium]
MIPLLVISGPIGVGKTTVSEEISNLLVEEGVSHTLLDLDVLAETYPRPSDDRFGDKLAIQNLSAIWGNCRNAGSRNLIIPRVIEKTTDLSEIVSAVPDSAPTLCQLRGSDETLMERVRKREIGSGYMRHEKRSLELSRILKLSAPFDFVVETDGRSVIDLAMEISNKMSWNTYTITGG